MEANTTGDFKYTTFRPIQRKESRAFVLKLLIGTNETLALKYHKNFFSERQSSYTRLRSLAGAIMTTDDSIDDRDIKILAAIARGPGTYATPSPDRIERLLQRRLIKRKKGRLRPTLKGRITAWLYRRG